MSKIIYADCYDPSNRYVIYEDTPHEVVRNTYKWVTYKDKSGKLLSSPVQVLLKDLDTDHLKTLCYFTLKGFPESVNKFMVDEWNYRIDMEI
ncbi:hypothetical protein VPHF99_0120 [Vibrio phage F99]|nr:hypothetical protein MYOV056v2_p0106 [Vibrio phage 184E37.3a]QZI87047.1 hypothetical protein MYOV085v1_p0025 [Vibrio phage 355E48.1]QZI89948.1 hypothetical protein MYOV057v1_p0033 [Vibrio phage 184E37.1]